MLNPINDRLDFGQLLAPPDNFQLDFAVGTTYSLDLDALVGASLALGLSAETDSNLMNNPICLLEALRATGDKMALFCEGGQIHFPNKVTPLYILLEKVVFQINTVKRKSIAQYPSFHPKFWLIRYVDTAGSALYRVIVLSRNLTFDRSWDVSFCMDGKLKKTTTSKNQPLADFLNYLAQNLGDKPIEEEKARRIQMMKRELANVHFEIGCKEFYDFDFIPTGIKKNAGGFHSITDYPLYQNIAKPGDGDGLHEILIMSPFLSGSIIRYFNNRNSYINNTECVLITRAMSLQGLKPEDCNNFKIYIMKDAVVDGEMTVSDADPNYQKQDIHAKVYLTKKYTDTDLYLGSLNASHNAVYGNIEFMIRLRSRNRYLNIDKLTASLFGDEEKDNPFQRAYVDNANAAVEDNILSVLGNEVKHVNRLAPTAVITKNGEHYDVAVHFAQYKSPYNITITPLLVDQSAPLAEEMVFSQLSEMQLSEFYAVTVDDGTRKVQRVIIVPTTGMPGDREKSVISHVVSDRSCFYRYVAFLLGDNAVLSALEADKNISGTKASANKGSTQLPALYEKMLQTAATNPEKLKEIDYLIQAISKDGVIPDHFEELYNTFRKAVKL